MNLEGAWKVNSQVALRYLISEQGGSFSEFFMCAKVGIFNFLHKDLRAGRKNCLKIVQEASSSKIDMVFIVNNKFHL